MTASELKAFQKDQRTQKRSTPVSEPPTKGKGKGTKGAKGKGSKPEDPLQKLDLACVQLQTKYLKAEGFDSIQVLQKADFGVDKQGVTLMTEREAEAFFPVKPLSTGPLAILALHECSSSSSDLVMLPAINKAGEPILLPIVISQLRGYHCALSSRTGQCQHSRSCHASHRRYHSSQFGRKIGLR